MARVLALLTDGSASTGAIVRAMTARLEEARLLVDTCRPFLGERPAPVRAYHGLLVMGTESVVDRRDQRWLSGMGGVGDAVREAARLGVPTLGLGTGHQVATVALGGTVGPAPYGRQRGLLRVGWACEVLLDPLFDRVAGEDRGWHHNDEVLTVLPPGGCVLAQTDDGEVQAARLAPTVWGVQFLPWADPDTGPDIDTQDIGGTLAAAFARLVRGRAGARGELWE